jgi:ABC-type bacteriocin/lantibiotic exporter with double-glycine peptidase domain
VHQFVNNLRGLDNPPTSLIISHDVEMVRHVDYVYMLNEGSIVASGLPAVILGQRVIWGDLLNTKRTIHE